MLSKWTLAVTMLTITLGTFFAQPIPAEEAKEKHLILIAGRPSHPPGMHEFNAGGLLLKKRLDEVKGLKTTFIKGGWPEDESILETADAIVIYADGGGGHPFVQKDRLKTLQTLTERGVGIGAMHYGVEVPADRGGKEFKDWIGGHYETHWSVNPLFTADFKKLPEHPITRGVRPYSIKDEWYFNMRFREQMKDITPILVTQPADEVRDGPYVHPAGPYPHIQANKGREEITMWAVERPDGGRGFGFTGGHFHHNWANDNQRLLVLNALLWVSGLEVPEGGLPNLPVSDEEIKENLDPK